MMPMPAPSSRARRRLHRPLALLSVLLLVISLSSCGLGTAGGFIPSGQLAGDLSKLPSLKGATISVGSKNFTEQLLLGKISAILLKSAGADVQDLTNIPGSASARQAQVAGEVDLEWEYTGTAWVSYLGHENPIPDEQKQYEAVRDEDQAENQLTWMPPAPMNNTYSFATTKPTAKKLGVKTLSDLKNVDKSELTFCIESEFGSRNDGFEPMLKAYGLELGTDVPSENVKTLDTGAVYAATAQGECNFGEVFTTDGRIKALNLSVLKDDKKFFPLYNVCPVFRTEIYQRYPQLEKLFTPVAAKLTDEQLIAMNAKVDVDGEQPADVAEDWLRSEGFLR